MAIPGVYEEVEIEDMTFDEGKSTFTYQCPCGDLFVITLEELEDGEDIAHCPSCTLKVRVIFDEEALTKYQSRIAAKEESVEGGGGEEKKEEEGGETE